MLSVPCGSHCQVEHLPPKYIHWFSWFETSRSNIDVIMPSSCGFRSLPAHRLVFLHQLKCFEFCCCQIPWGRRKGVRAPAPRPSSSTIPTIPTKTFRCLISNPSSHISYHKQVLRKVQNIKSESTVISFQTWKLFCDIS